jgi:5-methylcytosine-specific restriction endonuclease McrA
MRTGPQKRQRLLQLWDQQKGLCFYCKQPMILIFRGRSISMKHEPARPNEGTIEHRVSRLEQKRREEEGNVLVAACRQCNCIEHNPEKQLSIEEKRLRSDH